MPTKTATHRDRAARAEDSVFVPVAILDIAGGAAAAGFALNLGEKGYERLTREGPLSVRILDSSATSEHHIVRLCFVNTTIHGLYIESISLREPKGNELTFKRPDRAMRAREEFRFPMRVGPKDYTELDGELVLLDKHAYEKKSFGILDVEFSKLDEKKSAMKEVHFRIRWAA